MSKRDRWESKVYYKTNFKQLSKADIESLASMPVDKSYHLIPLLSESEVMMLCDKAKHKKWLLKQAEVELSTIASINDNLNKIALVNNVVANMEVKKKAGVKTNKYNPIPFLSGKMSEGSVTKYRRKARESFRVNKHLGGYEVTEKAKQIRRFSADQLVVAKISMNSQNSVLAKALDDHFLVCKASRRNRKLEKCGVKELDKRIEAVNKYVSVKRLNDIERSFGVATGPMGSYYGVK